MLCVLASPAAASTSFSNGSFETNTGSGQLGFNTSSSGWTTSGYNFLFASGSADSTGATGNAGNLKLWGPGDGSANGLTASSPDGGFYIAADGAYEVGAIQQSITGLIVGSPYSVGFYWGGAQQSGYDGATTEQWQVSFEGVTQSTTVLNDPNHGFTGWQHQTFSFIATSASSTLSFLAIGTPSGEPPFSLLDGVTLTQTPEPATFALIGAGLLLIPVVGKRRRKRLI